MKKTITTLGLILFCISIYAQTVSIKWGPNYEDKNSNDYDRCYGENENGYFRVKYKKDEIAIQKFNNQHEIVASREATIPFGKLELFFFSNLFINNKIYEFAYSSNGKIVTLYKKSFTEDLSEESEWEEFDKFNDIRKGIDGGKALGAGYDINIEKSEDNSKFIIYAYKSNNMNSIACLAYDKNFNKIWDKEFEIKKSIWLKKPTCKLSNDGTFIFSGFELPSSSKKYGNSKYNDIIYVCNKDGVENYNIAIENHYVSNLNFIVDDASKKMTIAGFYSDKKTGFFGFDTEGYLVGYFYKKIDLSTKKIEIDVTKKIDDLVIKNEINKSTFPISEDTKNQYVDGAIELPHEKLPNKYEIKKMVKRENGDISMICEYSRYDNETRGSFDYFIYYFGPILVVNFNNVGEMIKAFYIPKVQSRKGNQNTSFLSSVNNYKLTFVYYDNEKNYGTKGYIGAELPDFPDAAICAVTSDFDGNIIKREVIYKRSKNDKNAPYMNISNAKVINDKKYLIQINSNKSYQCGFLTFE